MLIISSFSTPSDGPLPPRLLRRPAHIWYIFAKIDYHRLPGFLDWKTLCGKIVLQLSHLAIIATDPDLILVVGDDGAVLAQWLSHPRIMMGSSPTLRLIQIDLLFARQWSSILGDELHSWFVSIEALIHSYEHSYHDWNDFASKKYPVNIRGGDLLSN